MTLKTSLVIGGDSAGAEKALADTDAALADTEAKTKELGKTADVTANQVRGAEKSIADMAAASQTAAGAVGKSTTASAANTVAATAMAGAQGRVAAAEAAAATGAIAQATATAAATVAAEASAFAMGALSAVLTGGLSLAVTAVVAGLGYLISKFFGAGEAAEDAADKAEVSAKRLQKAISDIYGALGKASADTISTVGNDLLVAQAKLAQIEAARSNAGTRGESLKLVAEYKAQADEVKRLGDAYQFAIDKNKIYATVQERTAALTAKSTAATNSSATAHAAAGRAAKGHADAVARLTDQQKDYVDALKGLDALTARNLDTANKIGMTPEQIRIIEAGVAAINAAAASMANFGIVTEDASARISKALDSALIANMAIETAKWLADSTKAIEQLADASSIVEPIKAANDNFTTTIDLLEEFRDRANSVGDALANAFGKPGAAIADMISAVTDLSVKMEDLAQKKAAALVAGDQEGSAEIAKEATNAQLDGLSKILHASKSLFAEHSAGYKAMAAAEKAIAVFRAAEMAKSLVETGIKVAEGASTMFGQLGVFAFPVVAAMIAVMAGLGFSGGSSAQVAPPSPEDLQKSIGTGTVLGDNNAQSDSIANALDIMAKNSNADLEYSNEAVQHLRAIEAGIGGLTAAIARQINVSGGAFDTTGFNLGTNGSSGILGLFGSSTTRSLYDQGLTVFQSTVGDILMQGVNAQVYNVIEQVKKKSGFLGIGGGTKTTYQTITGDAPAAIAAQFQLILGDVTKGVIAYGKQLGTDVTDYVSSVVIPSAQLSFLDMSGEDIQAALEAYFSSVADAITAGAFGPAGFDLTQFQQAGEGLFETLARVTKTMTTVSTSLRSINMDGALGSGSLTQTAQRSDSLAGLFGGTDALQNAVSNFSKSFLTEAEQMAPVIASVNAEMARLGEAGVTTKDQFKALVTGLDLSTDAGQQMFAELLAVAPAFAKATDYLDKLNGTVADTAKTAEQLAAIEKEHQSLQLRLLDLTDQAAAQDMRRQQELAAALDDTSRAMLGQIYAAQDAATQAQALANELAAQAAATEAAAQAAGAIAKEHGDLQLRLLDLTDKTAAEEMRRQQELAGASDDVSWSYLGQIYAAEDAQAAAAALADSLAAQAAETERAAQEAQAMADALAQAAAAIAKEHNDLQLRLLDLTDTAAAEAVRRQQEMAAALDDTSRALLEQIYAAEDAAVQAAALADALAAQAAATEAAAQAAAAIAKEHEDLQLRLLDLTNTTAAEAVRRQQEMAAASDDTSRAYLAQIYAAEDAAAQASALADAMAAQAAAADKAAQEAQAMAAALAQAAAAIAKEHNDLQLRLLDLTDTAAAQQMRRAQELAAALDDTSRAYLTQIYAAEDAATAAKAQAAAEAAQADAAAKAADQLAKAQSAAADAVTKARSDLTAAYGRESGVLKDTIKTFSDFGTSLRAFRAGLFAADQGTADAYRQTQVKFLTTAALAQAGDTKGMSDLAGAGQAFLDASRSQASSALQYQRDVAFVARSVDAAIGAADDAVDMAQMNLDAMTDAVSELVDLNDTALSLVDAMEAVREAIEAQGTLGGGTAPVTTIPVVPIAPPPPVVSSNPATPASSASASTANDTLTVLLAIKSDMGEVRRRLGRIINDDGLKITADADAPLPVEVV